MAQPIAGGLSRLPARIAVALMGAAVVYVAYFPSDSVAVEQGDALWFALLSLLIAAVMGMGERAGTPAVSKSETAVAWLPWMLAGWIGLSAWVTSPPGNLRVATNEFWWWVSAAALLTAGRRLFGDGHLRGAMVGLLMTISFGLAVAGLHQDWISLPANRAAYQADPDAILAMAGVDAPEGSSQRMIFENRLFDGGPTGTFALANSLAAILLLGAVSSIAMLRFGWRHLTPVQRTVLTAVMVALVMGLLATRSRSAMLALLVGTGLALVWAADWGGRRGRVVVRSLVGLAAVGMASGAAIAAFGNREWFEAAPASISFRLQYWRATFRMVTDGPWWSVRSWFGAGPGNYQLLYGRYRESDTTELIADPHNLFFETLASGGWIGLGIFLAFCAACILTWKRSRSNEEQSIAPEESLAWRWLALGAAVSLALVWLLGWASRRLPDVDASVWVLPLTLGAAVPLWSAASRLDRRSISRTAAIGLACLILHLCVSGGWTVPGVATWVWLLAAMLLPIDRSGFEPVASSSPSWGRRLAGPGCLVALMFALNAYSLGPVSRQSQSLMIAEYAQSEGRLGQARSALERAVEADPWSPVAAIWLADYYRWRVIADGSSSQARSRWEEMLDRAESAAGEDPAAFRQVGVQRIHVYQRHGLEEDLRAAADAFDRIAQWSPSNQWVMAQMAELERELGNPESAAKLATQARFYAELGGNPERALERQLIYPVRPMGPTVARQPARKPADELLDPIAPPKGQPVEAGQR